MQSLSWPTGPQITDVIVAGEIEPGLRYSVRRIEEVWVACLNGVELSDVIWESTKRAKAECQAHYHQSKLETNDA